MCDYSLHGIKNRLAEVGEKLVIRRFSTGSKGLTSPEYLRLNLEPTSFGGIFRVRSSAKPKECAVCIPDGAKLMLSSTEIVTFRQLTVEPYMYRDALEFNDGSIISLQEMKEGQWFQVLSLPFEEESVPTRKRNLATVHG